jgi:hypothetical protein
MMGSNISGRGLVVGAAVLAVVLITAAGGAVSFSNVAALTIILTLLSTLGALVLGVSWAAEEATVDVAAPTDRSGTPPIG